MSPTFPPLQPSRGFADRDPSLERALLVVGTVGVVSVLAIAALGAMIAGVIPPDLTVENPDRPPEFACEDSSFRGNMTVGNETISFGTPEACSEPARIPARRLVWRAVGLQIPGALFAPFASWLVVGGAFHVLSRSEDNTVEGVMVVAAWGTIPQAVGSVLTVGVLAVSAAMGPTPEPTTLDAAIRQVEATLRSSVTMRLAIGAGTTLWSALIHYHGLRLVCDLDRSQARELTALVAAAGLLWSVWSALSL